MTEFDERDGDRAASSEPDLGHSESQASKQKSKRGTLGWLAEQALSGVAETAADAVFRALATRLVPGAADLAPYALVPNGGGRRADRNDIEEKQATRYLDFSPPNLWGSSYTVLRVDVRRETEVAYMFHAGEELLFPTKGAVRYVFAQPREGKIVAHNIVVAKGEGVRINPQQPHHAASDSDDSSIVWMVMRYASDSARKVVMTDTRLYQPTPNVADARSVTFDQLASPATYALIAYGLSEMIRVHRQRADMTVDQLAKICNVDAALLSRLEMVQRKPETAGINVSLDTLLRVADFLCVPVPDLIWQSLQVPFEKRALFSTPEIDVSRFVTPDETSPISARFVLASPHLQHELHVASLEAPAGTDCALPEACRFGKGASASWIVMDGTCTVRLDLRERFRTSDSEATPSIVTLTQGSVLHFRSAAPTWLTAHTPTRIVQVLHSTECRCGDGSEGR